MPESIYRNFPNLLKADTFRTPFVSLLGLHAALFVLKGDSVLCFVHSRISCQTELEKIKCSKFSPSKYLYRHKFEVYCPIVGIQTGTQWVVRHRQKGRIHENTFFTSFHILKGKSCWYNSEQMDSLHILGMQSIVVLTRPPMLVQIVHDFGKLLVF